MKLVWTYNIQLWGCTKRSNINIIQPFQNKLLRNIEGAPWYIRNDELHKDLKMKYVASEIQKFARIHEEGLLQLGNVEVYPVTQQHDPSKKA